MTAQRLRLGDILELQRKPIVLGADQQYIRLGIYSWGRGTLHRDSVPHHEMGRLRYFSIPAHALLVSNIQAWEGALAVTTDADTSCVASNRFLSYLPRNGSGLDVNFVLQYLLSDAGFEQVQRASPGTQVRNRTLSIKSFENIEIPLPDALEQRSITHLLNKTRRLQTRMEDCHRATRSSLLALSASLVTGDGVPLGDVLTSAAEPVDLIPDQHYAFLGMRWYGRGAFVRETLPGRDVTARRAYRVKRGDIIYNRLFAWKGSFGQVGSTQDGCVVSNEFPTFRVASDTALSDYVQLCLEQEGFWRRAEELSTGSTPTSRNRLKEEQFLKMTIPIPNYARQVEAVRSARLIRAIEAQRLRRHALAEVLLSASRNEVFSRYT